MQNSEKKQISTDDKVRNTMDRIVEELTSVPMADTLVRGILDSEANKVANGVIRKKDIDKGLNTTINEMDDNELAQACKTVLLATVAVSFGKGAISELPEEERPQTEEGKVKKALEIGIATLNDVLYKGKFEDPSG